MFIDVQQNTDEWLDLRMGKTTSSNFDKICANMGKAFGNPAVEYAQKIALERVNLCRDERGSFKGKYFDDGHLYEPIAIQAYEMETFQETTNGGFNTLKVWGDSPDVNVGDEGCLEVKSVIANTQWKRLKKGGYDTAYKWQICGHIWLGDKEWCDFVSYCPEMPENKKLYTYRVWRDELMIFELISRLNEFEDLIKENVNILNN